MSGMSASTVRPSAIAGTWYPGSAPALRHTIEGYLNQVQPVALPGRLLALVCPHAGYAYSGSTAAHAYAQLRAARRASSDATLPQSLPVSRVVLLGPLHRPLRGGRFGALMVPAEDAYRTPLGDVLLDRPFINALGQRANLTPAHMDEEHSLEIQLPFLQIGLGEFSIVPIMLGQHISDPQAAAQVDALATALASLADTGTLMIASTDLSHMNDYADVVRTDRRLVDLVAAFDVDGLAEALEEESAQACGATGLIAVFRACQKLGATGVRVLAYAASGDITGDKRPGVYTVGYLAAAVYA
jgi:AmmeMemoRadiSam system protein B